MSKINVKAWTIILQFIYIYIGNAYLLIRKRTIKYDNVLCT